MVVEFYAIAIGGIALRPREVTTSVRLGHFQPYVMEILRLAKQSSPQIDG